jgi:hypothetical protein
MNVEFYQLVSSTAVLSLLRSIGGRLKIKIFIKKSSKKILFIPYGGNILDNVSRLKDCVELLGIEFRA